MASRNGGGNDWRKVTPSMVSHTTIGALFRRLATPDESKRKIVESDTAAADKGDEGKGKDKETERTKDNDKDERGKTSMRDTRNIDFTYFMLCCHHALNNGLSQIDALKAYRLVVATTKTENVWNSSLQGYDAKEMEMPVDEIFAQRLDIVPFYHAVRHLSDTYSEARGDRGAESPEEAHHRAEEFAEAVLTSLPAGGHDLAEGVSDEARTFMRADVLSLATKYEHGLKQLFHSYLSDNVLTSEPMAWSTVVASQIQMEPFNVETCCRAVCLCPDIVTPEQLQKQLRTLHPRGMLLLPQFMTLLWTIARNHWEDAVPADALEALLNVIGLSHDIGSEAAWLEEDAASKFDMPIPFLSTNTVEVKRNAAADEMTAVELSEMRLNSLLAELKAGLEKAESKLRLPSFGFDPRMAPRLGRDGSGGGGSGGQDAELGQVWHPMPCIVREVLRAPEAPRIAENLMEAALAYHNSSQYDLATQTYADARVAWRNHLLEADKSKEDVELPPRAEIFLLCALGSVHESAGDDEMALICYSDARRCAMSRLSHDDPDIALAYSHMGSVCYHLGKYELAARCFEVAMTLRQHLLGKQHPDTAAVNSSLGACLCMLGRMAEARYHIRFAAQILKEKLGATHPRTIVAVRNVERCQGRPSTIITRLEGPRGKGGGTKSEKEEENKKQYVPSLPPKTIELRSDVEKWTAAAGVQLPAYPAGKRGGGKKKKKKGKGKKKKR